MRNTSLTKWALTERLKELHRYTKTIEWYDKNKNERRSGMAETRRTYLDDKGNMRALNNRTSDMKKTIIPPAVTYDFNN